MNSVSVKKVEANELSATMIFMLKAIYSMDLSKFTVMYDNQYCVLYVNSKIPQRDIKKFLLIAGYEGVNMNDPDSAVWEVVNYIYDKYGYSTKKILWDFQNERRRRRESEKAKVKAAELYQLLNEYAMNDDIPDVFSDREFLIYHLGCIAMKQNIKTAENMVGYDEKMVFLYGYLLGMGVITENDTYDEDRKKTEYMELFHKYLTRMNTEQLKSLQCYANRILCSKRYC